MDVKFEKQQVLDLEILGTVSEILQNGTIRFNAINFRNKHSKVFVDLVRPDNTIARAFCSPAMSALVRSTNFGTTWQEKADNLMSMELIPTQRRETVVDEETGEETVNVIDMLTIKSPVSANAVDVKPSANIGNWKPQPIDVSDIPVIQ